MRCALLANFLIALSLASDLAPAQDAMRDRGFGRVTGRDGRAWAGATVHLLHRPHNAIADPAFGDRFVRTTDARGQFKAPLLVGSNYIAWAIGPVEENGSYRITKLVRSAVARSPILLTETDRQFELRVRPTMHPSWNGRETLRWRASVEGNGRIGFGRWLTADESGVLTLPRWPGQYIALQGWAGSWLSYRASMSSSADYAVRYGFVFKSKADKPTEDDVAARFAKVQELTVPPRRQRNLTLTAKADGKPVAGAAILHENMPFDLEPHRSDEQGIVHAVFAHEEEMVREVPFRWSILPQEHAEYSLDPSSYRKGDPPVMNRVLPDGRALEGQLLMAGEQVADTPLMIEASVASSDTGSWFGIDPRVAKTGKDGRFQILGRCKKYPFRLTAALAPAQRAELSRREPGWPVSPLAVLHWGSVNVPAGLGTLDLSTLRAIDVQVSEPDGSPPGSVRVLLTRVAIGGNAPHEPVTAYTDRRGRVRVLAPSSEDILVHATTRRGAAFQRLDANAGRVELKVDSRHVVKIRVVNGQGEPLAGASVGIVSPGAGGGDVDQDVVDAVRDMCMVHAFPFKRCRLDDKGYGEFVSPLLNVRLDLAIYDGDRRERRHVRWNGPTDEPLVLVIE